MTVQPQRLFAVRSKPRRGRARRGYDAGLAALRREALVPDQLEGLVALARVLADQFDQAESDEGESRFVRARVAVVYQAALLALLDRTAGSPAAGDDAALAQLLELLATEELGSDAAAVQDAS
jgi:hypothetical protein